MARPAVIYDPEHDQWAQLIISLPAHAAPATGEDDAPELREPTPAPRPQPQAATPAAPAAPVAEAAQPDELLNWLLGPAPATPVEPTIDLSTISPQRAARLAAILEQQQAAPDQPAAEAAPTPLLRGANANPATSESPRTGVVRGGEGPNYTRSTITDDGRTIVVNAYAVAGQGRRTPRRRGGVNVRRMRERAATYQKVRRLVAEGKSANEIDKTLPGTRKDKLALVRRAKAELGQKRA
jgi:hypothetical protein